MTLMTDLARIGPLPIPRAVARTLSACEEIAKAHALGIAHGNLGLDTVLPGPGDAVRIDWSSARPPTALSRDAVQQDIAALGVLLRALATGALPKDLESALGRAAGRETRFANVAELARAIARHAPRHAPSAVAFARGASLALSKAGIVGSGIPLPTPRPRGSFLSLLTASPSRRTAVLTFGVLAAAGAAIGAAVALGCSANLARATPQAAADAASEPPASADADTGGHANRLALRAVEHRSRTPRAASRPPAPHDAPRVR